MPAVSVIVPNYNHSSYLRQRIDSILNQTFQDFELILLDDCSNDNSKEIFETYRKHPLIKCIIYNRVNSGSVFKQWQKGIELATGDYIWIAESDDWCENNLLETLMKGIYETDNCVLAYCQSYCVIESNDLMWTSVHNKLSDIQEGKHFVQQYLVEKNTIHNASMALFRRSVFKNIDNDYLALRFAGDWVFWADVAVQGNVFISGRVMNYFRKHANDVTTPMLTSGYVYMEEIQVLSVLKQKEYIGQSLFEKQILANWFYFVLAKQKFKKEDIKKIKIKFYKIATEGIHNKMKWIAIRYGVTLKIKSLLSK